MTPRHWSVPAVVLPNPVLSVLQCTVHDAAAAITSACERMRDDINEAAHALAAGNTRMALKLAERGRGLVRALDPSRYGDEDEEYLRAAVISGMAATIPQPNVP